MANANNVRGKNMTEEIIKLKAEIFDIIQKQEEYISMANGLQQAKLDKLKQLKDSIADDTIKLKAEIFDIMQQQEEYMTLANTLQQSKSDKMKQLKDMQTRKIPDMK